MGIMEWVKYECRISRSVKQNDNYRIQDMTEAGYILAAISLQKAPIAYWLTYCYGIENRDYDRLEVACALFEALFFGLQSSDKLKKHRALCEIAVDDYRLRVFRNKEMPLRPYGVAMGITDVEHNWGRDWKDKRNLALDQIKGYDAEGVGNVSRMVQALRGGGKYQPTEILTEMRG